MYNFDIWHHERNTSGILEAVNLLTIHMSKDCFGSTIAKNWPICQAEVQHVSFIV